MSSRIVTIHDNACVCQFTVHLHLLHLFTWWRHPMEIFSALLAICAGNSSVTGEFPWQRPVTQSFDVFFDLCLNNGWVNNRDAGDWRRHRAHYDVNVMTKSVCCHINRIIIIGQMCERCNYHMTDFLWALWRLKSLVSRLFNQPFVQAQIKENIKAPRHCPLCEGNPAVTGEIPAQRASNAENVSIWRRHM